MNESKRLQVLRTSLVKKEAQFNEKLQAHFGDVKSANGQPLNDKRNGRATMDRWDRQDRALAALQASIEKTKNAIEAEEWKIKDCDKVKSTLPAKIMALIESGELVPWRKYPHIFFVKGVDKARIIWENGKVYHKYTSQLTDKDQRKKFASIYNPLNESIN